MIGHDHDSPFWIGLESETDGAIRNIGDALHRIAESLEYVAPMARWFFENADLIFKPKEDSNAQT